MEPLKLELPYPPTVNHYWLTARSGQRYISPAGRAFRLAVMTLVRRTGCPMFTGPVALTYFAHPPDRRKRDLDNIQKALLDALTAAGMWEDDYQVAEIHGYRREHVQGGRCDVTVAPLDDGGMK